MEELLELKELLVHKDFEGAYALVEDLEEMGKKGVARNIRSYAKVLLFHLIKQQVEQRTTKTWDISIRNSIREIKDLNTRPSSKGTYLNNEELYEVIAGAADSAIDQASIEAAEGIYDTRQIEQRIDRNELIKCAIALVHG
ncbi:DUF29 family protein [Gloeocapsopsis dulcis]|uniref:DUF29 domain-containing protein n=1 Tax=Gloeocapsopsis dulcis AAB1 = 1H9 TaxID=1433147 RepID=A0A6N8FVK0_9CHRO|nr:DUF29 family protein [Gloeocapsopsis dulcis]MUL36187.1 hypothetical protein [Gloeocapsopsis dulcis AAB1 = 1H9]WNN91940.1 DUF29 family protein [Gloeocapsopsis dulcis]